MEPQAGAAWPGVRSVRLGVDRPWEGVVAAETVDGFLIQTRPRCHPQIKWCVGLSPGRQSL